MTALATTLRQNNERHFGASPTTNIIHPIFTSSSVRLDFCFYDTLSSSIQSWRELLMLSRQLLSRGITSIRPSRLSIPTLRQNFHIQNQFLAKLPAKSPGRPKKRLRDGEGPPTSGPETPFALDIARVRAERKFLLGSRLKASLDKSEEDKIQRRKDTERLVIEEDKAESMEKPEDRKSVV